MFNAPFDIFCRVIDNYGDAGVCLRLARQLQQAGHQVKIYTDKPAIFYKLKSPTSNIEIQKWQQAKLAPRKGVVIEAFGCDIPTEYRNTIKGQNSVWINLEYLSAESWINNFHQMPSIQNDGTPKYFFFPGFSKESGGLLIDPQAIAKYAQGKKTNRFQLISQLSQTSIEPDSFVIFLFSYDNAPYAGLQTALSRLPFKTTVLVAGGLRNLYASTNVKIISLPFVQQPEFDQLLWLSDLNFVRGEDSMAQASLAPTPMVWQAYQQSNNTHIDKLNAWLGLYPLADSVTQLIMAWNQADDSTTAKLLPAIISSSTWSGWQQQSITRSRHLQQQNNLVTNLRNFCAKKLTN